MNLTPSLLFIIAAALYFQLNIANGLYRTDHHGHHNRAYRELPIHVTLAVLLLALIVLASYTNYDVLAYMISAVALGLSVLYLSAIAFVGGKL